MSTAKDTDTQNKTKRICLGKITQPHGVKGLVKVICYADDPALLGETTLYKDAASADIVKLSMKNSMGKYWVASIEGVHDRNQTDAYRNMELWADKNVLPAIEDENEFYVQDLIDMKARTTDGQDAGHVLSVQNFGASDLLEIKPPSEPSYYLPFTKENVPEIDIENGTLTIIVPEMT